MDCPMAGSSHSSTGGAGCWLALWLLLECLHALQARVLCLEHRGKLGNSWHWIMHGTAAAACPVLLPIDFI